MYHPWGVYKHCRGSITLINVFISCGLRWVLSTVKYFLKLLEIISPHSIIPGPYPAASCQLQVTWLYCNVLKPQDARAGLCDGVNQHPFISINGGVLWEVLILSLASIVNPLFTFFSSFISTAMPFFSLLKMQNVCKQMHAGDRDFLAMEMRILLLTLCQHTVITVWLLLFLLRMHCWSWWEQYDHQHW